MSCGHAVDILLWIYYIIPLYSWDSDDAIEIHDTMIHYHEPVMEMMKFDNGANNYIHATVIHKHHFMFYMYTCIFSICT